MEIPFYKYHGTGNDFILTDNRHNTFPIQDKDFIKKICHRNFGIGADGLILLENSTKYDFFMRYFNADGLEGSMCGNGGRCIVAFAKKLGIIKSKTLFEATDGLHEALIKDGEIDLKMTDVSQVEDHGSHLFIDTGSPHHIALVEGIESYPVLDKGREIRYAEPYFEKGSNVNFVEQSNPNIFKFRTYERGVENETLSCGTGATAVAIGMYEWGKTKEKRVELETRGGFLKVSFEKMKNEYHNVWLQGPATLVFEGKVVI